MIGTRLGLARRSIAALLFLGTSAAAQTTIGGWVDPNPHMAGFVTVAPGVRLHYLDFGGTGEPIVLLAGLGNTAHAYDDFAPRLTDHFHVIALTRRGFGESSHPDSGYETPRLVEDVRVALDQLGLRRVILIGHSIAGEEMTRFAGKYPDRVAKLVYLDAAYDRVAGDSMMNVVFPLPLDIPARPVPGRADTATAAGYVAYVHRTRGVNIPESDIRVRYQYDGWKEEATPAYQAIGIEHPNYRAIQAPALAIYAVTDAVSQLEPWQRNDRSHFKGLQAMVRGSEQVDRRLRLQFRKEVANSQVVEIHGGHHWVFVSHRDKVLQAVREFLLR